MKNIILKLFLVLFVFTTNAVLGQNITINESVDTTKTYKIEIHDGSSFVGTIILKDSISVRIKTTSIPKIELPIKSIKSIEEIDKSNFKKGVYRFPNSNATRYLFGSSAFNLKKGEGYYQNTYLILNSFNVGVTNNISIGGGIEFLSTFGSITNSSFDPIFFITPKVGFEIKDKFHIGGGLLYTSTPGFGSENRSSLGLVYGIGTYGTMDNNVTGGIGWGFIEGEFSERPIITIAGMKRIARNISLVTENWIIPIDNYESILSYGIRFFSEKLAVDLAFINNTEIAQALFIGIPYVDFVVKF